MHPMTDPRHARVIEQFAKSIPVAADMLATAGSTLMTFTHVDGRGR